MINSTRIHTDAKPRISRTDFSRNDFVRSKTRVIDVEKRIILSNRLPAPPDHLFDECHCVTQN